MSTDLEHDLRAAFDELAATTTISSAPRFGDVATRPVGDPRRARAMLLTAAAVVLALVGGLALLVRDRTADVPAPAATTALAPSETRWFLFPDASSDVRYDDPRAAANAYFADRATTAPAGETAVFTIPTDAPIDATVDRVLLPFNLAITPDDPALCCDSGDGVAVVVRVDGAWYVESAQILALVIDRLSYSDDGVVTGAYSPLAGGMYTATIDDFGSPGPEETGFAGEVPDDMPPGDGPAFRSPGHTAPAVAVRIWRSPSPASPFARAMFAEFIVPRGTDDVANISIGKVEVPGAVMLSEMWPTPLEAAQAYAVRLTSPAYDATVGTEIMRTRENEAWVRFDLSGAGASAEGIIRLVDTGWVSGTPAWAVSYAGTRGITLTSATYRDGVVHADFGTTDHQVSVGPLDGERGFSLDPTGSGTLLQRAVPSPSPTMALTLSSKPGSAPAFAEVLVSEGGENTAVDFGALLDSLFGPDAQVAVPAFVGLTEGQARALADEAGLVLEVRVEDLPAGDPHDGTVVEQGLASGTLTARGTAVKVTIGQARITRP